MSKKIIEPHWESFAEKVIPDEAPAVQIKEMEMAFYSGALMTFYAMGAAADIEDEEEAVNYVESIASELFQKTNKFKGLNKNQKSKDVYP